MGYCISDAVVSVMFTVNYLKPGILKLYNLGIYIVSVYVQM